MKKSDLKELIRKNIIQELSIDDNNTTSEYDFLYEKKKEEEEDIEITADEEATTEEPATDTPSPEDPALSDADQLDRGVGRVAAWVLKHMQRHAVDASDGFYAVVQRLYELQVADLCAELLIVCAAS